MLNLLPPVKALMGRLPTDGKKKSSRNRRDVSTREWDPVFSIALDDEIPPYFDVLPSSSRGKESIRPKIDVIKEQVMTLAPNERYAVNDVYINTDPSPLSYSERGVSDRPVIVVPLDQQRAQSKNPVQYRFSSERIKCLAMRTVNMTEEPITLIVQKLSSSMEVTTLYPGRSVTGITQGKPDNEGFRKDFMHCIFTKTDEVVVQLSSTQEIFTMQFECRPLGLVLEMRDDKIICTRVLEDSQAVGHENILMGAGVISVDDQRISTLEDFQLIVSALKTKGVGPRLQFVRDREKFDSKYRSVSKGSYGYGDRVSRVGLDARGSKVSAAVQAFDGGDDGLIAAVKVNRPQTDVWTYATSFGVEDEENTDDNAAAADDNDEDDDGLGSKFLLCVPPNMSKKGWGAPTALVQFVHLTTAWDCAELYWIDEGGALIFRKMLQIGDRHSELTSVDHVWLLNVTRRGPSAASCSGDEQYALIFQPCRAALRKSKVTTIVWIPRKSVTLSQRDIAPTVPQHKQKSTAVHTGDPEPLMPMLQIQIL